MLCCTPWYSKGIGCFFALLTCAEEPSVGCSAPQYTQHHKVCAALTMSEMFPFGLMLLSLELKNLAKSNAVVLGCSLQAKDTVERVSFNRYGGTAVRELRH